MFTPRARIQPDFLEILASKCIFNLWLRRRSGRPDVPAHRQRLRRLNALDAQPFLEAVVCTIDSIMGGAADEDKYGGSRRVASMFCRVNGEKYRLFQPS